MYFSVYLHVAQVTFRCITLSTLTLSLLQKIIIEKRSENIITITTGPVLMLKYKHIPATTMSSASLLT